MEGWTKEYEWVTKRLARLGLAFEKDEEARDELAALLKEDGRTHLEFIRGKNVLVAGAGSAALVEKAVRRLAGKCVLIATDGALERILSQGIVPEVNCTDLDGNLRAIKKANELGSVTVVHAHGDNIELLKQAKELKGKVVGTTQVNATARVHNFGGFTDGDRGVFIAKEFSAKRIGVVGIDGKSEKHAVGVELIQRHAPNAFIIDREERIAEFEEML